MKKINNTFKYVQNFISKDEVAMSARLGIATFKALYEFTRRPSIVSCAKASFDIFEAVRKEIEMSVEYYVTNHDMVQLIDGMFANYVSKLLCKHHQYTDYTKANNFEVGSGRRVSRHVDVCGCEAFWYHNVDSGTVCDSAIWVRPTEKAKILEHVKQAIAEDFGIKPIVITRNKKSDDQSMKLTVDCMNSALKSEKSDELAQYIKRFYDAGVNRSLMLFGPPGTGKSTLARAISDTLGLRPLRLSTDDIDYSMIKMFKVVIELCRPDVIILDDFDRAACGNDSLLEFLEYLHEEIPIVIATVNDTSNFSEAMIRPGRFDEIILVNRLGPKVIKYLLGDLSHMYETVKEWPVAFIKEYVTRAKVLGELEAEQGLVELSKRVKKMLSDNAYCDKSDWELLSEEEAEEETTEEQQ